MLRELKVGDLKAEVVIEEKDIPKPGVHLGKPIELVGQDRAQKALNLALLKEGHIAMVGDDTISPEVVRDLVRKIANKNGRVSLTDKTYVFDFDSPPGAKLLVFDAGKGKEFKKDVHQLRQMVIDGIEDCLEQKNTGIKQEQEKSLEEIKKANIAYYYDVVVKEGLLEKLEEEGLGAVLDEKTGGIEVGLFKVATGEIIFPNKLPPAEQEQAKSDLARLIFTSAVLKRTGTDLTEIHKPIIEGGVRKIKKIEGVLADKVITELFDEFLPKWKEWPEASRFLEQLRDFAKEQKEQFLPPPLKKVETPDGPKIDRDVSKIMGMNEKLQEIVGKVDVLLPFRVNLLVDNSDKTETPIVIEKIPSYRDLFGGIERKVVQGMEEAPDHTNLKAGALHMADGGFLILDLNEILDRDPVFRGLMRALKENQIAFRDFYEESGVSVGRKISIDPIPLNLKIVAMVHPGAEYYLRGHHWTPLSDFMRQFSLRAEFGVIIENSPENRRDYILAIRDWTQEQGIRPCTPGAYGKIIEALIAKGCDYEADQRGTKTEFACSFPYAQNLVIEAEHYAEQDGSELITGNHIEKTLDEIFYRDNLREEALLDKREKDIYQLATRGEEVGQVNALAAGPMGRSNAGVAHKTTAVSWKKTDDDPAGLTSADKEGHYAGDMYLKAMQTITGYLNNRYGRGIRLNYRVQISFEQEYHLIDGPSASLAKGLICLSSISGVPLRQDYAITGTMNHLGIAGPIGGGSHKIRAFFKACENKGLTGTQGIVIPEPNVQHLMLCKEVVEAVRQGKFHIYSAETLEDAADKFMEKHGGFKVADEKAREQLAEWSE